MNRNDDFGDDFGDDFELDDPINRFNICYKDNIWVDIEVCLGCTYLSEKSGKCLFGEVSLEDIQEEQIREREYDIAIDKQWCEK